MTTQPDPDRAVSFDEIGIATARHGRLVLRSAFQLVFRPHGEELRAVAAESFLRPFRDGMPLPPRPFLASLDQAERLDVEQVALALHAANHVHIGVDGLSHMIGLGPAFAVSEGAADILANCLAAMSVGRDAAAPPLVCGFRATETFDAAALTAAARDFRALGVRLSLAGPPGEQPPLELIANIAPDIVRIDGAWFRRVAASQSALRLLTSLVAALKAQAFQVLAEGIETRGQLAAALDIGADLVQGFLLSHPLLAGMVVESTTIARGDFLPDRSQVIPLFGTGR